MALQIMFKTLAAACLCSLRLSLGVSMEHEVANRARELSLEALWSSDLTGKVSPIKHVVTLLKNMKAELDQEAAHDGDLYDKQVCWCETSEKEKENSISEVDAKDKDLSAEIESRSARFGALSAEIEQLKKQISVDAASLKESQAIREKEAGDFRGEEKDLVQAITNLKNAIRVLSRHQSGSLVQLDGATMASVRAVLRDAALKHEIFFGVVHAEPASRLREAFIAVATRTQRMEDRAAAKQNRDLLAALNADNAGVSDVPLSMAAGVLSRAAKASSNGFLQTRSPYKSYNTRSDSIFGILTQLLEDFEAKLKASQESEAKGNGDYKKLSEAKVSQLEAGKTKLDELETEQADNQKKLSDAKEDLEIVRKQRSDDVEFLRNLKLTCQDLDKQWSERSQTRSQEIIAVAETLEILSNDSNRETLTEAANFLQASSTKHTKSALRARKMRASSFLLSAARAPAFQADDLLADWHGCHQESSTIAINGPRAQLSTLAIHARIDGFTKVKEMMDKMVSDLKKQQEEEVQFKADCANDLDENEKATYTKEQEKNDMEGKIELLAATVTNLKGEIEEATKQIAETEIAIKQASHTREDENAEFQSTVSNQRAVQDILKKALSRLEDFYNKHPALVQQTPPVQFTKYKVNAGASPVIGLIEQIIGDSAKLLAEVTEAERAAQADYEAFVKDSNALKKDLSEAVTSKTKVIADTTLESEETKTALVSTEGELESLATVEADLHSECDWVLKNFDIRQNARLQEMEAIEAAKGILSGAK